MEFQEKGPDPAALRKTAAKAFTSSDWRRKYRKLDFFRAYPKQLEFFALGAGMRERLLMAGNQVGKTYSGAAETAFHLTGEYPKDWPGRRFTKPTRGWAAGETSLVVRDVQQKLLCGEPGVDADFGSGLIPLDAFADKPSMARGVTDAYDTIQVKHRSGGTSVLRFKSYEQGRTKFQGETLDFLWWDEEPDLAIYSEGLTRTTATAGMTFMTFTPLKGPSLVVSRFLNEPSPDRAVVGMTIEDAEHIPAADREKIIAGYPEHEREARAMGKPLLGSGAVFRVAESSIKEAAIEHIPAHWFKLWALDFGIAHAFAAVLILWDKDNDVIHVHHAIRLVGQLPIQHAAAMKPVGAGVPVAWPHDGTQRDKGSGEPLSKHYKNQGLMMLPEHATWPEGGYSLEAGILEMQDRFTTGRLKIAAHLSDLFEELRFYHRKDGQIVKLKDDLISALRIAIMAKRFARQVPLGSQRQRRRGEPTVARDVNFDPWNP